MARRILPRSKPRREGGPSRAVAKAPSRGRSASAPGRLFKGLGLHDASSLAKARGAAVAGRLAAAPAPAKPPKPPKVARPASPSAAPPQVAQAVPPKAAAPARGRSASAPGRLFKAQGLHDASSLAKGRGKKGKR